jgi:hypothetical protein
MQIVNHGALPPGTRDFTGIFTPLIDVEDVRAKVAELRTAKAKADRILKHAVELNDGRADLNALSRTAHRLGTELAAAAEEELEKGEALSAAQENERKRVRFVQIRKELQEQRAKVLEHYREAALALGRYYALGNEATQLANALADRLGNGSVFYPPHLRETLTEAAQDPNPLPVLRDSGLGEIQTSFRRHIAIVPLKEKP